jgi:PhoD-like phosphatase
MESIRYPNILDDVVVLGFKGARTVGFTVKPVQPGFYRLLIWPEGLADPDLYQYRDLHFRTAAGSPLHCIFRFTGWRGWSFRSWIWVLRRSSEHSKPLKDLAEAVRGAGIKARGSFRLHQKSSDSEVKIAAWSCHMPYETDGNGNAVFGEHAESILNWYASQISDFQPHIIWGEGDTGYSDGTTATDFSNQVYDKGEWYRNPLHRLWLKEEYRNMYRYFWSFAPMRTVMREIPHLFIWDDHEIHDGWGSEGKDFETGNFEMFRVAKEVAEEYILNAGPRVRPDGEEAHQSYFLGSTAAFLFDTRSKRNYEARDERLISREQYGDFVCFLDTVSELDDLTDLLTCTTVPFVNLRTWVTDLVTRVPDFINSGLLEGIRDDVRDSWTSPGNIDTLIAVLQALAKFMRRRPEVRVWNISGDIHVANAYEIWIPGVARPVYQVTTSAITNRTHPSDFIAELTEIKVGTHINGVGYVRRIWDTITEPNILLARLGHGRAEFTLAVWNEESPGSLDLRLVV